MNDTKPAVRPARASMRSMPGPSSRIPAVPVQEDEDIPLHPYNRKGDGRGVPICVTEGVPEDLDEITLCDLSEADIAVLHRLGIGLPDEENSTAGPSVLTFVDRLDRFFLDASTVEALRGLGLCTKTHMRLALHSLLGDRVWSNRDRGGRLHTRVRIGRAELMEIEDRSRRTYNGQRFLEAHREILPEFRYSGYRWCTPTDDPVTNKRTRKQEKWPRQVINHGLPPDVVALVEDDLRRPLCHLMRPTYATSNRACPDFSSGHGRGQVTTEQDILDQLANQTIRRARSSVSRELIQCLNRQPTNTFTRLVGNNIEAALASASEIEDERERLSTLMTLRLLQVQPKPYYQPSSSRRTVRIFPLITGLLSLPGRVRRALTRGCLECDLANALLAVAARDWEVPELRGVLLNDAGKPRKVWPYLFEAAGFDHDALVGTAEYELAKSAIKCTTYALMFGMSVNGLRWLLMTELPFSRWASCTAAECFLSDPLIKALLKARESQLEAIVRERGGRDCFGIEYPLRGSTVEEQAASAPSVLASVMQARELQLLEPVVQDIIAEQSKPKPAYRVMAWQHDGLTVHVTPGREQAIERRLTRLVDARARELKIPTMLEVEWL